MERERKRNRGRDREWRSEARNYRVFTVFVSNLPRNIDRFGLKGVFRRAGEVSDAFIPQRKAGNRTTRYGFVNFKSFRDARRSIAILNNAIIRSHRIQVEMARHRDVNTRNGQEMIRYNTRHRGRRVKKIWRRKEQHQQNRVVIDHGNKVEAYKIVGNTNTEAEEWLQRSIVCEAGEPIEVKTLYEDLRKAGMQISIKAMSCYKFIITFQSSEIMEENLKDHGVLDKWFRHINKWSKYEKAETRQVWLEIFGVPVIGWTEMNFKEIAKIWGSLVRLEEGTDSTVNFESMKMLITSDHFHRIESEILLQIEDMGYRVFVSEIGGQSSEVVNQDTVHQLLVQNQGTTMIKETQKPDQMGATPELKHNLEEDEAVQRVKEIQNSNMEPNQACLRASPAGSDCASSHTKALCCSHIDCSTELITTRKGEAQHTNAFIGNNTQDLDTEEAHSKEKNQQGKEASDVSSSVGPPPGFEQLSKTEAVPNSAEGEEEQTHSEDSAVKTAREALQIGNLIGLKITHNEKGAEARIVRSQRSNRKETQQSTETTRRNTQKTKRRI